MSEKSKKGRYKLYLKFNEKADKEGVTLFSYDNPYNPNLGLEKLKIFAFKVRDNEQLKIAVIYDTNKNEEIFRLNP